jgi:hypothetical protein
MMNRTLFLLLLLLPAYHLSAQEVRFGAGFNTLKEGNTGNLVSLSGGTGLQVEADAQFGQRAYVQPGIGYIYRTLTFTTLDPLGGRLIDSPYSNHSLRLSLIGGYRFLEAFDRRDFNIRGFFGPSVLVGMGSRFDNADVGTIGDNTGQWFLTVGGGVERDLLFLDVGYDVALNDAFDAVGAEGRLNMLRVTLGVRLRFIGRTAGTSPVLAP